jgi:hypothetical protein
MATYLVQQKIQPHMEMGAATGSLRTGTIAGWISSAVYRSVA